MTPPVAVPANGLVQYMMNFNFDLDAPRIFRTSGIYNESSMEFMSANSTDLREFRRRGNKLIIYHGEATRYSQPTTRSGGTSDSCGTPRPRGVISRDCSSSLA
jgi:feruloyl esterase